MWGYIGRNCCFSWNKRLWNGNSKIFNWRLCNRKKNCCNDEQLVLDGQDELQFQTDAISFDQQVFIASFLYSYQILFKGLDKNLSSHLAYKPPLVIRQLYKIDEMYLIWFLNNRLFYPMIYFMRKNFACLSVERYSAFFLIRMSNCLIIKYNAK